MAMQDPSPSESTTGFSGGFVGFAEKHLRDRGAAPEVPVLSTVNAEWLSEALRQPLRRRHVRVVVAKGRAVGYTTMVRAMATKNGMGC